MPYSRLSFLAADISQPNLGWHQRERKNKKQNGIHAHISNSVIMNILFLGKNFQNKDSIHGNNSLSLTGKEHWKTPVRTVSQKSWWKIKDIQCVTQMLSTGKQYKAGIEAKLFCNELKAAGGS